MRKADEESPFAQYNNSSSTFVAEESPFAQMGGSSSTFVAEETPKRMVRFANAVPPTGNREAKSNELQTTTTNKTESGNENKQIGKKGDLNLSIFKSHFLFYFLILFVLHTKFGTIETVSIICYILFITLLIKLVKHFKAQNINSSNEIKK